MIEVARTNIDSKDISENDLKLLKDFKEAYPNLPAEDKEKIKKKYDEMIGKELKMSSEKYTENAEIDDTALDDLNVVSSFNKEIDDLPNSSHVDFFLKIAHEYESLITEVLNGNASIKKLNTGNENLDTSNTDSSQIKQVE